MTSPYLLTDIMADEGFRAEAYPDPLSGGDPWTVGYGATGPTILKGTVWTQKMAQNDLAMRVGKLTNQLQASLPWFRNLADLRQDVLVNMAYQLGFAGLLGFHRTLGLIADSDYEGASKAMMASAWAKQTPNRAKRLSLQMNSGLRQR